MVLFAFGRDADSWLIGNPLFTAFQNLPESYGTGFRDKILSAENVSWGSVGPDNLSCFLTTNDEIYCTQIPNLVADLKPALLYGISIQQVDHVAFSPGGGWFVRYTDGRVRLSMVGTFSASFRTLVAPYLPASAFQGSCQESTVEHVFFGAEDAVLIKLTNGSILWEGLPESLEAQIREKAAGGWILSKNSTLCQYDKNYYFVQWTRLYGTQTMSAWNVKPSGFLTDIFIREIAEGQHPVSHTLYQPPPTQPPPTLPNRPSSKDEDGTCALALFDYQATEANEIGFVEGECITDIEFADTDWWRGKNQQGEIGLFPRNYVELLSIAVRMPDTTPSEAEAELDIQHESVPSLAHVTCDGCTKPVGDLAYHCAICNNGDYDLCKICFDIGAWCFKEHSVTKRTLKSKSTPTPTPAPTPGISSLQPGNQTPNPPSTFPVTQTPGFPSLFPGYPDLSRNTPSPGPSPNPSEQGKDESEAQKLRKGLESTIIVESPNVHWDDVAGLGQAKEELQESIILPMKFPQLFTGKRKARTSILLYGPPGTGKSYLAKAVATEVKCPLFSISSSDIMSKWLGESEKLVKNLFEMARERKPSIIFIDEIEALCSSREAESENLKSGMKTEFLVQMDGVGHDNSGILVLAATNLPWTLDAAMRRRFQRRIHIGLPDEKARTHMFEIGVGKTPCDLKADDYARLGSKTEGFSGSDISIVVQEALMQPVKKINTATHYRKVNVSGVEKYTPSTPSEPGSIPMSWRKVPADKLLEPPLLASDFFNAVDKIKPSVSEEDTLRSKEWTKEYGLEGA